MNFRKITREMSFVCSRGCGFRGNKISKAILFTLAAIGFISLARNTIFNYPLNLELKDKFKIFDIFQLMTRVTTRLPLYTTKLRFISQPSKIESNSRQFYKQDSKILPSQYTKHNFHQSFKNRSDIVQQDEIGPISLHSAKVSVFASHKLEHNNLQSRQLDGFTEFINEKLVGEMNSTIHEYPYGTIKEACDKVNYEPVNKFLRTSVVLTFHNTEILENLLRTMRSIIKRTPTELLEEVVLIADNVVKDELTTKLDEKLVAINRNDIITLVRSREQLGLIKARLLGIRTARGEFVVCLDSHMEVQERWLEPLAAEIRENPKTLVSPSLDWMSFNEKEKNWRMKYGGNTWITFFDWSLAFGWQEKSQVDLEKQNKDVTKAFISPMTIGTFGIRKEWFKEVGEFDEGMEAWGGENIDLPLRVWLFGGRVVNVPCSHIAHFEKPGFRDYRQGWDLNILRNHKRIIEVWWDDYRKYFYYSKPDAAVVDAGNLSARLELKKKAKHNFKWFLENIYPELRVYDIDVFGNRGLKNLAYPDKCLDGGGMSDYNLYYCDGRNAIQQGIFWTIEGDLQFAAYRANTVYKMEKNRYVITGSGVITTHKSTNSIWFHWRNGPFIDPIKNLCLEAINPNDIAAVACQINKKSQLWTFSNYTKEYQDLWEGIHTDPKNAFLYQLDKILKAVKNDRLLEVPALVKNFTSVLSQWKIPSI